MKSRPATMHTAAAVLRWAAVLVLSLTGDEARAQAGVATAPEGQVATTPAVQSGTLEAKLTKEFFEAVQFAVWDRVIPGATWWVEHRGGTVHGAYGLPDSARPS